MKRIVIVDDNAMFLMTLLEFIKSQGKYECIPFSNPTEALGYLDTDGDTVDILLTDYEMPYITGLALAKEADNKGLKAKVIVMSGHDTAFLKKKAKEAFVNLEKVKLANKSDVLNITKLFGEE